MSTPQETQIGGTHYKDMKVQPYQFIMLNNLSFLEGCVVKRMCRHRRKNGIEDLRKAIHEIELMIELEYGEPKPRTAEEVRNTFPDMQKRIKDAMNELPSITGSGWHNPENVTQEQLGEGYRFLVPWEVDGRYGCSNGGTVSVWLSGNKWGLEASGNCQSYTYRVPASTPIPPKP